MPVVLPGLLALLLSATPAAAQNVLLVVADDLGVDKVGIYGAHPDPPPTPTLDALASAGLLFRNAYSDAVCSPTRTTIMTGLYGVHSGIGISVPKNPAASAGPWLPPRPFLPALLPAGHRAAAVGKWHLTTTGPGSLEDPITQGFERYEGSLFNLSGTYFDWQKVEADAGGAAIFNSTDYVTTVNVDDALEAIEAFGEQPWFVYLALHAPHKPFHVPPAHLHDQPVDELSPAPGLYRAMVQAMDSELARLLGALRPAVLARTTVIFVGDNGTPSDATTPPFVPEHAKGTVYEGGIHVPLIIAGRGVVSPGREVWGLVNTVDLFPTVLELAGASPPPSDGVSLLPYLRDGGARGSLRTWVHSTQFTPNGFGPWDVRQRAIRDRRYKLIRRQGLEPLEQFFDVVADPFEQDDLLLSGLTREQQQRHATLSAVLEGL